jgi:hypothetical protein
VVKNAGSGCPHVTAHDIGRLAAIAADDACIVSDSETTSRVGANAPGYAISCVEREGAIAIESSGDILVPTPLMTRADPDG